jgi:hypothetical protein
MTITCTSCGSANDTGDTFCGSCSAFLEWEGAPAPGTTAVPVSTTATAVAASAPTAPTAPVGPPAPQDPQRLVPAQHVPDTGRAGPGSPARAPQAEAARPGPRRAVPDGPSDHYCGSCGAGNALGRVYCRACGTALADADPSDRAGWFDRWVRPWWPFGRRRRARAAGERPSSWSQHAMRQQRRRRRLRLPTRLTVGRLAIPLMLLSLFGLGLTPLRATATTWAFETYDSLRLRFSPDLVAVVPAAASADSHVEGHPPLAAVDANSSSYWSEGREGPGIGATLTVDFASPTDLAAIGVHNGATDTGFARQPRVRTVQVDTVDVSGAPTSSRLELEDTADFRSHELTASAVTLLTMTIVDVYPGQEGQDASLTEVTFHVRK